MKYLQNLSHKLYFQMNKQINAKINICIKRIGLNKPENVKKHDKKISHHVYISCTIIGVQMTSKKCTQLKGQMLNVNMTSKLGHGLTSK